ncbi:hypothetical protein TKK_0003208 [Trichogramma kaykai]|uniref:Uncharacterized protein n=1 Tax=Trichogramma kaykai TaxID=54128 RepID=A0ABD2WTB4_9HYME
MAAPSWWFSTIAVVVVVDCQKHSLERRIRSSLQYPEDSEMGLFFALAVPLDDPDTTKAISMALFFEANYKLTPAEEEHEGNHTTTTTEKTSTEEPKIQGDIIDRRGVYRVLQSKFQNSGYPGKECVLRSICETTSLGERLHAGHNGLLGDILRITFTPSSSSDESLDEDYARAENYTRRLAECADTYSACPISIYENISLEEEKPDDDKKEEER